MEQWPVSILSMCMSSLSRQFAGPDQESFTECVPRPQRNGSRIEVVIAITIVIAKTLIARPAVVLMQDLVGRSKSDRKARNLQSRKNGDQTPKPLFAGIPDRSVYDRLSSLIAGDLR